ncbi:MAG: 3-deoxy-D-manno-octulosonic acid transferase [Chlamydiae bacterium]|nr:3-deoxy-D-manno-octulosonic acid transferase [Chlamydiota bacterium]
MLYDFCLLLGAIYSIPKWLIQKKYRGSRLQRFGFRLPNPSSKTPSIWIHMVSVGETKAMIPIYERLRTKYPTGAFFLSSTTKTGHNEAKRSLPNADGYFFLPLDLSWIMRRLVLRLKPDLLLLSESDFWLNLISEVKKQKGKVVLLNGKISARSSARFAKFPSFSKRIFAQIDRLCIQNTEYATRFQSLYIPPEKITITGNLKLSIPSQKLTPKEMQTWRDHFGLLPTDRVITIGSTHEGEEEILLPHIQDAKVLLAPRRPERFAQVKKSLEKHPYPNVQLVDQMGILHICYQLSDLAIVGGSFLPGTGGHNIFEPIQAGIPVLFGPHMETQKELVDLVLNAQAGIQTPHQDLAKAIPKALILAQNASDLAARGSQPLEATWEALQPYLLSYTQTK